MSSSFDKIAGGVVAAKGFRAHGVACGIKEPGADRLDLAAIVSDLPAVAAGVFTSNKVKAAPVRVSQAHIREADVRAIVANSGNANAATGVRGVADARAMAQAVASELGVRRRQVLVGSTGIIGIPLPMERIVPNVPGLIAGLSRGRGSDRAARAIMTSDTKPKHYAVELKIGASRVRIGGIAKGAGMICPDMATMLCFITTDARIDKAELQKAVACAAEHSFNRITIDGDMSTNDSVMVLANGAAGNRPIRNGSPAAAAFRSALTRVMLKLAKAIVRDGERVTKFVEVNVRGAATYLDARRVAEAVAKSTLVKCSWNGSDPNWGRILDAVGYSRARIKEELVDVYFGGLLAAQNGMASPTPPEELKKIVANHRFSVTIDLNLGDAEYVVYTSDLSQAYVEFNASEYNLMNRMLRERDA